MEQMSKENLERNIREMERIVREEETSLKEDRETLANYLAEYRQRFGDPGKKRGLPDEAFKA